MSWLITPVCVLERNDLVYNVLPPRWVFGLPIGNGVIGGMVWVRDAEQLISTLDHVWAWDHRKHPIQSPEKFNYPDIKKYLLTGDMNGIINDIIAPKTGSYFNHALPAKTYVGRLVYQQQPSGSLVKKVRFIPQIQNILW